MPKEKSKIRRINFFGGACCGKSTIAPYIFSMLKMKGFKAGFAQEYVKQWAYRKLEGSGYDQLLIFANQLSSEELPLKSGELIVVSESPILLSSCYAEMIKSPMHEQLFQIVDMFEEQYPSLNIRLLRDELVYVQEGRYGDLESATKMDEYITQKLKDKGLEFAEFRTTRPDEILEYILKRI